MTSQRDTIDLAEVLSILRRRWRWLAIGALGGALLAGAVTLLLRPRYDGTTTVLLRSERAGVTGIGGSPSGGVGSIGGLASILSGSSGFETEMEILTSRSTIGAVVDSFGLQARVREPETTPLAALFERMEWDPHARPAVLRFARTGDGYRVTGPGADGPAMPGVPYRLGESMITLRRNGLPEDFEIQITSRESAIDWFQERLDAEQAKGDVAELVFRADDPATAAAAPNALVAQYLERRRTTDRGVNQRRYEFLSEHTDSIRVELARAEQALRRERERSGVFDPTLFTESELERGLQLRADLDATQVEARALREVLRQAAAGGVSARGLAAYPTFLGNPAINNLLARLQTLEADRTALLERRTERDPDVQLLNQQIEQAEAQLVSLARSYLDGLSRRELQLRREVAQYEAVLSRLPAQAEAHYRAEREVRRLSETLVALQTQLVQARLAAIAEGGDVRQVDVAVAPEEPDFPRPALNLAIGLLGGLLLGMVGALGGHYLGDGVEDEQDAELAAGVPAVALRSSAPLLLGGAARERSVLVVPVGPDTSSAAVAGRIASTAALQGVEVVVANFEGAAARLPDAPAPRASGVALARNEASDGDPLERVQDTDGGGYVLYQGLANGGAGAGARTVVDQLEKRFALVVAALPPLGSATTTALLSDERPVVIVASPGRIGRGELRGTVDSLRRAGIRVSGLILQSADREGDPGA